VVSRRPPPKTPLTTRRSSSWPTVPAAITAAPFTAGDTVGRHIAGNAE
jgi:hypothetical protein